MEGMSLDCAPQHFLYYQELGLETRYKGNFTETMVVFVKPNELST